MDRGWIDRERPLADFVFAPCLSIPYPGLHPPNIPAPGDPSMPAQMRRFEEPAYRLAQQLIDGGFGPPQRLDLRHIQEHSGITPGEHSHGRRNDLQAGGGELMHRAPHMGGMRHQNNAPDSVGLEQPGGIGG